MRAWPGRIPAGGRTARYRRPTCPPARSRPATGVVWVPARAMRRGKHRSARARLAARAEIPRRGRAVPPAVVARVSPGRWATSTSCRRGSAAEPAENGTAPECSANARTARDLPAACRSRAEAPPGRSHAPAHPCSGCRARQSSRFAIPSTRRAGRGRRPRVVIKDCRHTDPGIPRAARSTGRDSSTK